MPHAGYSVLRATEEFDNIDVIRSCEVEKNNEMKRKEIKVMDKIGVRRVILLLAMLCLGTFRPAGANVIVAENGNHDLTEAENVKNNVVELNNCSTLTISSSLGADAVLNANIKILAGAAATLSVGEGVSSLRIEGGLYALAGASLAVTGIGTVSMGKSMSLDAINSPPLDIENLTFSAANATGLVLTNSVTIRHAPTNMCPLSISSGDSAQTHLRRSASPAISRSLISTWCFSAKTPSTQTVPLRSVPAERLRSSLATRTGTGLGLAVGTILSRRHASCLAAKAHVVSSGPKCL